MTAHTLPQNAPQAPISPVSETGSGKFLTFSLGKEEFGIQVVHVREIIGLEDITPVPGTPAHLKGVINLRGKIIPVVDLRLKFDCPAAPFSQTTCIIVVQVELDGDHSLIGLIVDGVSEVLNLSASDIEKAPDFGEGVETPFILGIAKVKGAVKILLKIEDVLTLKELRGMSHIV